MKRIALTLIVLAAAAVTAESTASASDRSHGRSSAAVRHAIGDLIFGGHSYSRDRGHSSYQAPSHNDRSSYGRSPSYSQRSYSRPRYSYSPSYSQRSYSRPSYGYSNPGYSTNYGNSRGFGYSNRRCD